MKVERGFVLAGATAILLMAAIAGSGLSLKRAETAAGELATARKSIAEQLRVSQRVQAQISARLAKTDATVYRLTQTLADLKRKIEASTSAHGSAGETLPHDALTPPEAAVAESETTELARQAIANAETLVATAAQAGRWTEQDRDRLHELLVEVDGRERQRIESGVGKLLVEGTLVTEGDFVPL